MFLRMDIIRRIASRAFSAAKRPRAWLSHFDARILHQIRNCSGSIMARMAGTPLAAILRSTASALCNQSS